uniref:TSP1_spondin domain-containing protein n=1 Tax=Rhabditophanes sp. KR3021 TaxID=114890 RepID=A0AC35UDM1_9BILA
MTYIPGGSCGFRVRKRKCLTDPVVCPCVGDTEKTERCNHKACVYPRLSCCHGLKAGVFNKKVACMADIVDVAPPAPICCVTGPNDGIWDEWQEWTSCTASKCGACGESTRKRKCMTLEKGCNCEGDEKETKTCKQAGVWSAWVESSACTKSCGSNGVRTLSRTCPTEGSCACNGPKTRTEVCGFPPCIYPEDSCAAGYKAGVAYQQIVCLPLPEFNEPTVIAPCTTDCCVIGGVWSAWGPPTACTATCGSCGQTTKKRTCTSTVDNCPCAGSDTLVENCNLAPCIYPKDSCCTGYKAMSLNGAIICGPQPVVFEPKPVTACMPACCPKFGIWSDFGPPDTSCTEECGSGVTKRRRICLSAANNCPCVGSEFKEEICNTQPCIFPKNSCTQSLKAMVINGTIACGPYPVPVADAPAAGLECSTTCCARYGLWSEWSAASVCSDVCGSWAKSKRTRECLSEATGCPCIGESIKEENCGIKPCVYPRDSCNPNFKAAAVNGEFICSPQPTLPSENPYVNSCPGSCCPENGMWSEWKDTSATCSDTCGGNGSKYQSRTCLSESFGCKCTGEFNRSITCQFAPCVFPRNSCATGLKAMVIAGVITCGPLPVVVESAITKTTCCPPSGNGVFNEWGAWSACPGTACGGCQTKTRTRTCASMAYGCPCKGDLTDTDYCSGQPCVSATGDKSCCAPTSKSMGPSGEMVCIEGGKLACPADGVWTEWGSSYCTDTCGMCGKNTRKRTCTTLESGCPCTGSDTEATTACGTVVCTFPRAVCCTGFTRKIVGKQFICS